MITTPAILSLNFSSIYPLKRTLLIQHAANEVRLTIDLLTLLEGGEYEI
jgi:hypothetical protein